MADLVLWSKAAGGFALTLMTSWLGFCCLALAMSRHWTQVTDAVEPSPARRKHLRMTGYSALTISLILAVGTEGASFGSLLWVMALTMGAAAVASILTWRPHWLRPLAWVATPR